MLFQKKPHIEKKEDHNEPQEHHGLFGHKQEMPKEEHHELFSKKEDHNEPQEHHGLFGHKQEMPKEEHHGFFSHNKQDMHKADQQEHHGLFGPKKEEIRIPMKEDQHFFANKESQKDDFVFSSGHVDDTKTLLEHISRNDPNQIEAPLFVKVEKYNDLISILQEMKSFSSSVKNVYNVLTQIEALRTDALNLMKISVQRLEKNVIEMDTELIRPKGLDIKQTRSELDVRHIEDSLEDLQKQLSGLKTSLNNIQ